VASATTTTTTLKSVTVAAPTAATITTTSAASTVASARLAQNGFFRTCKYEGESGFGGKGERGNGEIGKFVVDNPNGEIGKGWRLYCGGRGRYRFIWGFID
jgi:hypothetical protein